MIYRVRGRDPLPKDLGGEACAALHSLFITLLMGNPNFATPTGRSPSSRGMGEDSRKDLSFLAAPPIYQESDPSIYTGSYSPPAHRSCLTPRHESYISSPRPDSPLSASSVSSHQSDHEEHFLTPTPTKSPIQIPSPSPLLRKRTTSYSSVPPPTDGRSFAFRVLVFLFTFVYIGQKLTSHFVTHLESMENLQDDFLSEQESLLSTLHREQDQLNRKYESLLREKVMLEAAIQEEHGMLERLHANLRSAETLQEGTQALFRKLVAEKFGPGPHYVEFEVMSWRDKQYTEYFTIELAPAEDMPVTVYTFLEQIDRGLWDGTSFYLNEPHALSARPVSGNGQISRRRELQDSGFGSILFHERSEEYAHSKYSVTLKGNGPEFFINKSDNAFPQDATCFGEVVIGRSVIDQISEARGPEDSPSRIKPVDIVHVNLVRSLSEKAISTYKSSLFTRKSS